MVWVTRKATGKVVGQNVPDESLELYLSVLPTGVYAIEDSDGNELNVATVKCGHVRFADQPVAAVVPAVTVLPDVLRSEGYEEIAGQSDCEGGIDRADCIASSGSADCVLLGAISDSAGYVARFGLQH